MEVQTLEISRSSEYQSGNQIEIWASCDSMWATQFVIARLVGMKSNFSNQFVIAVTHGWQDCKWLKSVRVHYSQIVVGVTQNCETVDV